MATEASIIARVRLELGDQPEPFRQTFRGTGFQNQFDLPANRINVADLKVFTTYPDTLVNTDLVLDVDYTVDVANGIIETTDPVDKDYLLTAQGTSFGLFTDDELKQYCRDALLQHTSGDDAEVTRYRDSLGFIRYERIAKTVDNLPEIEVLPVGILATVQCLWGLLVDSATDIDITTAEGTHVPRSQRFAQLQALIQQLTNRYEEMCRLLGIGLFRIEVSNLRRVSRTTNRLVPIYTEREYDDHDYPIRILPRIDVRDSDPDGPPSPYAYGGR